MRVLRIDVDGTLTDHDFAFKEIQHDLNGAYLEGRMLPDCMLLFDEDGHMHRLRFNPVASIVASVALVGTVFAVNPDDNLDLDPAAVHRITHIRDNLIKEGHLS